MNTRPLVSIIVPVYNAEKYIARLLESIMVQTWTNIEVVCIDDGSQDQSFSIIKKYCDLDNRIKCIKQQNQGVSIARNTGFYYSKGEYIVFFDADDFIDKNMIERMTLVAIETKADIVSCGYYYNTNVKIPMYYQYDGCLNCEKAVIAALNNELLGMAVWNKLFDRKCINNVFFSPELSINEDRLFLVEAILNSSKIQVISDILYYYCMNSESVTNQPFSGKQMDAIIATERICNITLEKFPDLTLLTEATFAKTVYNVLVLLYRKGNIVENDLIHKNLVFLMKNTNVQRIRKYLSKSLYVQFLGVKYCEPLLRLLKKCIRGKL